MSAFLCCLARSSGVCPERTNQAGSKQRRRDVFGKITYFSILKDEDIARAMCEHLYQLSLPSLG